MAQYKNSPFNLPGDYHCRYCGKECKNKNSLVNHERYCKLNPNRVISNIEKANKNNTKPVWNKGLTASTDNRVKERILRQKENYKRNPSRYRYGHPQSEASKEKIRQSALKNGLGGFHMRRGIYYNGVKLDSSYEVTVAESLDKNNIKWKRCTRFQYCLEDGSIHHYTPDFYLPEFDVYLDPKNDFLIENINPGLGMNDVEKINIASSQNNIRVIVLDKDHLTWEKIKDLI